MKNGIADLGEDDEIDVESNDENDIEGDDDIDDIV